MTWLMRMTVLPSFAMAIPVWRAPFHTARGEPPSSQAAIARATPYAFASERVHVVHDRGLAQQDLADDVRGPNVIGVDRREAGAAGGQALRDSGVVEPDADDER